MILSRERVRATLSQLLHLREPPHRTALAFAIGVLIGFSPAYGFHTAVALASAWLLRLNVLAVLAGSFVNNPWTVVPILGATMWLGFAVMGIPHTPPVQWQDLGMTALYTQLAPYLLPFAVGASLLSLVGATIAYLLLYRVLTLHARHQRSSVRVPEQSL